MHKSHPPLNNSDNHMVLALRIDVDNPFGYSSRFRRQMNRISINYGMVPRWTRLGYLDSAIALRDWLIRNGVIVTWFFRTVTCPTEDTLPPFKENDNRINVHAERTSSAEHFEQEVRNWERICRTRATGFTKHGSGMLKLSRMHDVEYNAEKMKEYAGRLGLHYFIGNGIDYTEPFERNEGFTYVPSVFWLDRIEQYNDSDVLEKVVQFSDSNPVVVLVHPVWWIQKPIVRENLSWLTKKSKFVSLESIL